MTINFDGFLWNFMGFYEAYVEDYGENLLCQYFSKYFAPKRRFLSKINGGIHLFYVACVEGDPQVCEDPSRFSMTMSVG